MKNKQFYGIYPSLPTPINEDYGLNRDSAEKIINWQLERGVHGFYINGAAGEGPLLPESTRMEFAEVAVSAAKDRGAIINHIGSIDFKSTLRLAKHAGQIGCDAVSSVVPNYFFKFGEGQILDYYKHIADASGLPVLVYVNGLMNLDVYDFMAKAIEIDGVAGLKYTMYDYYTLNLISRLNGGDINVINGPDEMLVCGIIMGADAGIGATYNVMPDRFVALYNACQNGEWEKAREIQYSVNNVIGILRRYTTVPAIKEFFRFMGIDTGGAVYPGRSYSKEETDALKSELIAEGCLN